MIRPDILSNLKLISSKLLVKILNCSSSSDNLSRCFVKTSFSSPDNSLELLEEELEAIDDVSTLLL